jgi:hypothetical protein
MGGEKTAEPEKSDDVTAAGDQASVSSARACE